MCKKQEDAISKETYRGVVVHTLESASRGYTVRQRPARSSLASPLLLSAGECTCVSYDLLQIPVEAVNAYGILIQ